MECDTCIITVFFEDPFWVGLYERSDGDGYSVCKLTFGAEPRDYQVYEALLVHWRELRFSSVVSIEGRSKANINPKRARREAGKALSGPPVGTKAQEAMKLQRAEGKEARREKNCEEREAEEERKFLLRQEKKKQKHRGH